MRADAALDRDPAHRGCAVGRTPDGRGRPALPRDLLIDNQNPDPLPIKEIRFKLRITGQGVLTVRYSTPVTVEALDRQTLRIDVDGDVLSSVSQLRAAAGPSNRLPYEIFGNITLDRAFQNTLPFTANGAVPLAAASER